MEWIDIKKDFPKKEGKYIVQTLTRMKNIKRFECTYSISDKNVGSFNVSNQIVTHWLKEN